MTTKTKKGILLALGGNALIRESEAGDIPQQYRHTRETFAPIVPLVDEFERILIVHGNGPQVGNELLRNEIASFSVEPMPLDICVANSQGSMGYMIQQVLVNELNKKRIHKPVVTVVTQTLVDANDAAFKEPSKPIGIFYKAKEAERYQRVKDWQMMEDAGRGFRRVVPSPKPTEILELSSIQALYDEGSIVIAGGGGGVPVIRRTDGTLRGVEAVVDKDYITALFACKLKPEILVMLTAVEQVYIGHNTDKQRPLAKVGLEELITHYDNGEFGIGSMEPKIRCAIDYLQAVKGRVLITSPERLAAALEEKTGTWIELEG